jgi:hypothetical protein
MRIAFDMDGVLADLHTTFVQTAVKLFPELDRALIAAPEVGASPPGDEAVSEDVPAVDPTVGVAVSRRQSDAIWTHLGGIENFWMGLREIEGGAVARLASLADERRWDVLFITSRPTSAGFTVQRQTQRWLQQMGFPLPSAYVVHGSRGRVAQALDLDVVVDDRPDNCLDVVLESKAAAVLIWRGPQAMVPASAKRLGIAVSPTVNGCLDALIQAEVSASEGSLLDRMRRLFGLRTRSAASILRRGGTGDSAG